MKFELLCPFALSLSKGFTVQRKLRQAQPERGINTSMGQIDNNRVLHDASGSVQTTNTVAGNKMAWADLHKRWHHRLVAHGAYWAGDFAG